MHSVDFVIIKESIINLFFFFPKVGSYRDEYSKHFINLSRLCILCELLYCWISHVCVSNVGNRYCCNFPIGWPSWSNVYPRFAQAQRSTNWTGRFIKAIVTYVTIYKNGGFLLKKQKKRKKKNRAVRISVAYGQKDSGVNRKYFPSVLSRTCGAFDSRFCAFLGPTPRLGPALQRERSNDPRPRETKRVGRGE